MTYLIVGPREGVIPKPRVFTSGARNLACSEIWSARDPSLRLEIRSARDDTAEKPSSKLSAIKNHFPRISTHSSYNHLR